MKKKLTRVFFPMRKKLPLIIMRTFLLLFCTTVFSFTTRNAFSQEYVRIDTDMEISVDEVFNIIEHQTQYSFLYPKNLFKKAPKVQLKKGEIELSKLLFQSLSSSNVGFSLSEDGIIVIGNKSAQDMKVSGTVTGRDKQPIAGVTIWLKGTRKGVITNGVGKYSISGKTGDTLVFSFLGYKKQHIAIANNPVIDVVLLENINSLEEVTLISTGYQKISKERSTGSVSIITSKELEKVPVSNIMHKLEGQVAGLQVDILESDNTFVYSNLFGDGEGRTSYNFRIRGQSTYQGNEMPLIIVDGAPTELDIRTLNPNDIEKVTFLKDAASASIYGARAANGVIVIDTKKGKTGKTKVSYSQSYSFSGKPSLSSLPLMNASQVLDLEQELIDSGLVTDPSTALYLSLSTPISDGMETMFEFTRGNITKAERDARLNALKSRNNYSQVEDYLLQASESNTYDLSLSGGVNDYSYYTSASFSKEKTQAKGNEGKRLTLTFNQDFKLFNYAKLNTSIKGSFFNYEQNALGLSPLNASLNTFLPYNEIVDETGTSVASYRAFYSGQVKDFETAGYLPWTYNYMDELDNKDNTINQQNYSANINVTLPLVTGLNAVGTYFIEQSYLDNKNMYNEDTYYTRNTINQATYLDLTTGELTQAIPEGGIYQNNKYIKTSYTGRGQLNFNKRIRDIHAIDAMAGIELRQTKDVQESGTLYGYNSKTQSSVDLPSTNYISVYGYSQTLSYGNARKHQRRRFLSYYGNAAYTYNDKYTISGSVRLDDYNNFGVDKKYRRIPLWSTGAKWNISKETFLADVDFVNSLSLRTSYGFNGNISLTTYPFTNISVASTDYNLSGLPYAFITSSANPALRWEKTGILNLGLDFSLFKYRLNGSIEYYRKNSKDLIQDFPVSEFYGLDNNSLTRNTATLKGSGIDLNLTGIIIKKKDFDISSTFVMSYNTNEVTDSRYESYANYLNGTGSTPPIVGYGLNSIFAFRSAGLDNTGATQVYDKDGNIVDAYTALTDIKDMKYMGTSTPSYYGSLSTTISYKKWSLYALATYKLGYKLFKPTFDSYVTRWGTFSQYSLNTEIDNRWREAGDEAVTSVPGVQGMSAGYSYSRYRLSDNRVIAGDHIRFREVALSYDLSDVLSNTFIQNMSLSFTARNLGIIWRKNNDDVDPDFLPYTGSQIKLPPTAIYSLGLSVNF